MLRIEIIANHSVEENILEAFSREGVGKYYTKFPSVFGAGGSGPRMGDAIWPEENFALVIWCEADEAKGIERAVKTVKKGYPDEGIKIFGMDAATPRQYALPPQPVYITVPAGAAVTTALPPVPGENSGRPPTPPNFGGEEF
jgi:hypothetical protein